MDKQMGSLDPKLKEAYERVMGTATNPQPPTPNMPSDQAHPGNANGTASSTTSKPFVVAPTLTPSPSVAQSTQTPDPSLSTNPGPIASVTPPPSATPNLTQPAAQMPLRRAVETINISGGAPQLKTMTPKSKKGISPIIVTLGLVVFFAAYTLVWIKLLNIKVPFLPF